jgi:spermidine synthase
MSQCASRAVFRWLLGLVVLFYALNSFAQTGRKVIFERISQYHHIQVYDEGDVRTLSFNGSWESTMSLTNPLTGHFEYTEYFQMPFIWNPDIKRVLMAGLGGGSTPRAFQHYYTNTAVDIVELDPAVVEVAKTYFHLVETPKLQVHTNDARQYMRLSTNTYDLILMDAYATGPFGSEIPASLTTKEFFTIANKRLSTNGILAYNIIGQIHGSRERLLAALYRTMKEVFPEVYLFPANESQNVVFIATRSPEHYSWFKVEEQGNARIHSGLVTLPTFAERMRQFINQPPPNLDNAVILTDDYSPVESLIQNSP